MRTHPTAIARRRVTPGWRIAALFVVLVLGAHGAARAQDSTRRWSLGADHESGIYLGLGLGSHYRLEPELGIVRSHDETQFDVGFGGGPTTEIVTTASYLVGAGLLRQWEAAPRVRMYLGPRVGIIATRMEDRTEGASTGQRKTSRTDVFVAGSVGAEYFPVDRISFGADVQLRGISQGHTTTEESGSGFGGFFAPSNPTLATRGLLMVRLYL